MIASLPIPQAHIVCTEFDNDEAVLVDLNAKRYYTLNETALLVWHALEQRRTLPEIVREMSAVYDVAPEHAHASIEKLLAALRAHKLLDAAA